LLFLLNYFLYAKLQTIRHNSTAYEYTIKLPQKASKKVNILYIIEIEEVCQYLAGKGSDRNNLCCKLAVIKQQVSV
jgi:hypothetical protein